jgi:hypothetical protein
VLYIKHNPILHSETVTLTDVISSPDISAVIAIVDCGVGFAGTVVISFTTGSAITLTLDIYRLNIIIIIINIFLLKFFIYLTPLTN